jgi:hypothetical protein
MGLFNFFRRKKDNDHQGKTVSEDIFTAKLQADPETHSQNGHAEAKGIYQLFLFFEKNHEARGYEDALVNPDNSHLVQNTEALKNEMERIIKRVKTFYEDFIQETNFHISSRSRSGMVDTVEELTMKKEIAQNHIQKVLEMEEDLKNNRGDGQGVILSYTRGFRNGLAAISHHNIFKTKF